MKFNNVSTRVFVLLGLTAMFLFSVVGCAGKDKSKEVVEIEAMEEEKVAALSFDALGGSDVMPIVAYYGPKPADYSVNGNDIPDNYTEEYFELIAGTGINAIGMNLSFYDSTPSLVNKMLDLAAKFNIGVTVQDRRIFNENVDSLELVDSYVKDYANHPAYIGNYLTDEPYWSGFIPSDSNRQLEVYAPAGQRLNELGYFGYVNLWAKRATGGNSEKYIDYLREYASTYNAMMISQDMYPFDTNAGTRRFPEYFDTMSDLRQVAEEFDIPFWSFIQAGGNWNDAGARIDTPEEKLYPSKGEVFWHVGASLAFGAKGVQYFPLIQPNKFAYSESDIVNAERNGLIGLYGNKTRWYYYVAEINKQVAAVDHVLMNAVNKGVICSSQDAIEDLEEANCQYLLEGTSWRELEKVSGEAMVGCFNYQGKTALYVVNYDTEYAQKIHLDFVDKYDITVIQNAKEQKLSREKLELVFAPGESALVVFE